MGDCKNAHVVFLLFGRSQSHRMLATCNTGCSKKHNRMLHNAKREDNLEQNPAHHLKISLMEEEEQQNTSFMATKCEKLGCVSLQTVSIIVEMGVKI